MLLRLKIKTVIDWLLIGYLVTLIFLYPYGLPLLGKNNLRVSDLLALPLIFLCLVVLSKTKCIKDYPVLNSFVLAFIAFELCYPILGLFSGYEGLGAISNTLRMALIWLPFLLYIHVSESEKADSLDGLLNNLLKISILINLVYGLMQIASRLGVVSPSFLITKHMIPFAVDEHFRVTDGIRASGFFVNTTGLSVFAILTMTYFLARFIGKQRSWDALFILVSFVTVVITTSRAAVLTACLTLFLGWIFFGKRHKIYTGLVFLSFAVLALVLIDHFIGLDVLFGRFFRLLEGGASDKSFSARSGRIWPKVFQKLEPYEYGTLVNAVSKVGLVDSGYLTYYAQGKWPFIVVLVLMLVGSFIKSVNLFINRDNWGLFLVMGTVVYLGFTMVVLNPIRSPFAIFFLLFGLWLSETYAIRNAKN
ncbi:hypothetical protein [Algoriphagus resistens]|uniref:hypothetical protein n=1 Tax=Algoriphagus resistens TaxID=1750590 RepID=UPI000716B0AC|nr:hypothetical protein [Algoriphagus resistens]